jgi:hypothetical protein
MYPKVALPEPLSFGESAVEMTFMATAAQLITV